MSTPDTPTPGALGLTAWLGSVPLAGRGLAAGFIRRRTERVGRPLRMSDGRTYIPFRETVMEPCLWCRNQPPAVLQARFHLRGFGPDRRLLHRLFRRVCIVTTPFFAGLEGFRSKLWMADDDTGDYAGLYEWDDAATAERYARGLMPVLRALSDPGSVTYEVVAGSTMEEYLGEAPARAA